MADDHKQQGTEQRMMLTLSFRATPGMLEAIRGVLDGSKEIDRQELRETIKEQVGIDLNALDGNVMNLIKHELDFSPQEDPDVARVRVDTDAFLEMVRQVTNMKDANVRYIKDQERH